MTRAQIIGVGAYAPKRILTNEDLERMVETSSDWIVQRTGIRERHVVDENEATSDLAIKAAQQALERAEVEPGEIDLIVVGTTTGDMAFPTTANIVQHQLGCRNAGSMDVYAACSGSIYSLSIGSQYVASGKYQTVLCIGAESLSRITDYTDRGTCILLADAAGAAVLRATEGVSGIIDTDLYSDGRYGELLIQPAGGSRHPATHETVDKGMHYCKMKGNEVFKVAVRMFGDCAESPHHRGRGEAAQAPHGARDRERGPLRQHGGGLGLRSPRGSVDERAARDGGPRAHGGLRRRFHVGRGADALVGT